RPAVWRWHPALVGRSLIGLLPGVVPRRPRFLFTNPPAPLKTHNRTFPARFADSQAVSRPRTAANFLTPGHRGVYFTLVPFRRHLDFKGCRRPEVPPWRRYEILSCCASGQFEG